MRPVYHEALDLSRSAIEPISRMSLGMVGGIQLPQPIPREAIRKEGLRRHYDGEGLRGLRRDRRHDR